MSLVRFRFWAFSYVYNKSIRNVNDIYGPLAQVVEHLTFNQVVPGSSPGCLMEEKKIMMGDLLFLYYEITSDVNSDYEKCEVSM